jgi:hypothetical protein
VALKMLVKQGVIQRHNDGMVEVFVAAASIAAALNF